MRHFRISAEGENDIDGIVEFTTLKWGWRQADRYLTGLEECFELLAENPSIGRTCDHLRPGLRRFEIGRHVVFYSTETDGVLIVRVLHQQMLYPDYF